MDTDAAGNVYVLGTRATTGTSSSTWGYDIRKYTASGSLVSGWPKSINTRGWGLVHGDLVADASGNVYLTGGKDQGTVDFNPHPNQVHYVTSGFGAFVLKLTSAGNFGWVSCMTPAAGQSLTLDGNGNVIFGGYYLTSNTPYFATSSVPGVVQQVNLPTTSTRGGFIAKLNGSGMLTWIKGIANTTPSAVTYIKDLATDAAGNIYLIGDFQGTIDLDPGAGTAIRSVHPDSGQYDNDVLVVKLNSAGDFVWGETFGGSMNDVAWGIAVDPTGTIHFAGGYHGAVDFDPDPTDNYLPPVPGNYTNIFLVRLRQS